MNRIITAAFAVFLSASLIGGVNASSVTSSDVPNEPLGLKNARKVMRSTIQRYKQVSQLKKKAKSKNQQKRGQK
ncbi:MAG TPA: hypothetical protein DCS07_02770 [Bdellovibrionales bacterium]|nr:MAG: hypothetical protein A2Z97_06695 [Bdellovibrionales bacterium GWB1_52_6]OFZ05502.1 MAG: hypothetical protein A2X97_11545 [Bdellovibrionales bacterium GWA1_52_35]OFZ42197.1 MAG: hypothetical protein A2070_00620 [Bdellovibrionales bacterium GWC1_52_8]HAR41546.1 hypothetical protein [Bdellovibrionales bacterium]HCM39132.1 hypothetical protein [Bdellovibrionales bacterium]